MAHETVTQSKRFYCVSITPDICKTPIGNSTPPIPYTITGEFKEATAVSPNVKMQSEAVILHNKSVIPTVKGDAPGSAGGIKSGTFGKKVETNEASTTKGSNNTKTVQESRLVWMNDRNTIGRIYERGVEAARPLLKQLADAADKKMKEAAQHFKSEVSQELRNFGDKAMDAGGTVLIGSAGLGAAGAVAGATIIGLPAAAGLEVAAAATGTVGTVVSGSGAVATSAATVGDMAADYILTGTNPNVSGQLRELGANLFQSIIGRKLPGASKLMNGPAGKAVPGKKPATPKNPKHEEKKDSEDGKNGGKGQKPDKKNDKPSDCCPKNAAASGKSVKNKHPVHFGTGEEILHQTDFVVDGPTPIAWTRSYRSGSECEDWGLLGARWSMPYLSSLSVCKSGIVYHDDTGRALRLPPVAIGATHDNRAEGFILRRDSDKQFTITLRDGHADTFVRGLDSWLPNGYNGVNAMLAPRSPVSTERFYLTRSAGRDGKGIAVERFAEAKPGEVLLRLRTDDGRVVEAMREALPEVPPGSMSHAKSMRHAIDLAPRIGCVDEVHTDGTRVRHVSYRYAPETVSAGNDDALPDAFAKLPRRVNLVAQFNLVGASRTYYYQHHLLVRYTTYSGFAHGLEWSSLAALRDRWAGSVFDDAQLAARHPISLNNSYQARAIRTTTTDGIDEVKIVYIDQDTTRVTEADGGVVEFTFNADWLATDVRRLSPDGGPSRSLGRRDWDRDGMLLADVDADGNATRYTYDSAGNLTGITDARRHTTRIEYDAHNQPIAVTNALGHTARRHYDASGKMVQSADELGRITRYRYDTQGRLSILTDARGGNKQLSYDRAGRLAAYTDCSGYTNSYAYDTHDRLIGTSDAQGNVSRYKYDALGRIVAILHPDQTWETSEYDADGNLVAHTDAKNQVTRYRYNGHGVPIERIDAKGQTLQYRYDRALRLIELINGNGESYYFGYDAESRLIRETGFDGKTTTYTYDSAGHLIASDCNGVHTDFMRDALGMLLAKSNADGSVRYAYDALGRLTAVASTHAEQHFIYDPVGQLTEERSAYFLTPPSLPGEVRERTASFTLSHAYDVLGNRLSTTLPNGRKVDTLRYGSGHWHGTLWQGKPLVDLERDHLHRETTRHIGTGNERLTAMRSYDPQSRLSTMMLDKGLQRLSERHYAYDANGNLTRIADARRGNIAYSYDAIGQLLSAVQPDLTETFAFDPAGNVLDVASATHSTQLAAESSANQPLYGSTPSRLAKVTHNLLRRYLGHTYAYDVEGNTISKRLTPIDSANDAVALDLTYDAENRLRKATRSWEDEREIARYTYDAFGRRIAKQVRKEHFQAGQNTGETTQELATRTTLFVWDSDVMIQELQPDKTVTYLYEPDSFVPLALIESAQGLKVDASSDMHLPHSSDWELPCLKDDPAQHVIAWRAHDNERKEMQHQTYWQHRQAQATQEVAKDRIYYYQCDHLGTPLELRDEKGETVWAAQYKAWGRVLRYTATVVRQPLRFQGQYHDVETGLHYNRFRYYDPDIGRFVSQDPIGLVGGNNLYQYAFNPTGWIDPLGLAKQKCAEGRFRSADGAAKAALTQANPRSIRDNLEYGGLIYRTPGGRYDFTKPVRGTDQGVNPGDAQGKVPECSTIVGDYHTHGDYSVPDSSGKAIRTSDPKRDGFGSDNFSKSDYDGIRADAFGRAGYRGYLGTPSGTFRVFNPSTGLTSKL